VAEKYATLVEALYGSDDRVTVETQVIFEDGRSGTLKAELLIREVALETPVAVA
jgi:long-chain acyl-CoA synthetase